MSALKGSKKFKIQKCTNCVRSFLLTFFHGLLYRLFPVLQQPSECDCLLSVVKIMARRESSALKPQGQSLSVEDTDFLKKNTKYSEEDIKLWFKNFKKDCPNGILDKKKVCEIYEQKISPNRDSKFIVDQLFRIIDDDNNGGIDFKVGCSEPDLCYYISHLKEFMLAVNMAVSGTPEEKLRWMFRSCADFFLFTRLINTF